MICKHRRIKKNYSHGKKSTPSMYCKDCGTSIKHHDLKDKDKNRKWTNPENRER